MVFSQFLGGAATRSARKVVKSVRFLSRLMRASALWRLISLRNWFRLNKEIPEGWIRCLSYIFSLLFARPCWNGFSVVYGNHLLLITEVFFSWFLFLTRCLPIFDYSITIRYVAPNGFALQRFNYRTLPLCQHAVPYPPFTISLQTITTHQKP